MVNYNYGAAMSEYVTIDDIRAAAATLRGVAVHTPLLPFQGDELGNELYFKPECLQKTGSFKIRGAYNKISSLSAEQRQRGVITYSSGNHAQGVACAAHLLGCPAIVVMPATTAQVKIDGTRGWGAEIIFVGDGSEERRLKAEALAAEHGYAIVPPYDDPYIIAGQGTIGLEVCEDLAEFDAIVVPIGGGGLISGIATAVKSRLPNVRVIGVEPEGAADAYESFRAGHIVEWPKVDTIADGLRTQRIGEWNWRQIQKYVDDIVTVSEDEIRAAMCLLARHAHLVAEPSGSVATAAIMSGKTGLKGQRVVAVISGGNVDPAVSCAEGHCLLKG
jgi:threonine ammonia-lyase medium form